jgi:integrase
MARRKGNRWEARAYGKYLGMHDTREEAEAAEDREAEEHVPAGRIRTVEQWAAVWLRDYPRPAPATRRTYRLAAKQIVRDLGSKRLLQVDPLTARQWANRWPHNTTRAARTMFGDARRAGLIRSNPFSEMRLEQPRGRKDLDALTEKEIFELAESAHVLGTYGPEFRALLIFLGFVGCRPGELCCIRRDDVDHERGEVTIRFALDGEGNEKAPKNGKPRVVTVPPPGLAALADVPTRISSPYLFHSARGKRLSKGTLSHSFRVVRAAWGGRERVELYALRHACATLLMERGLPPHVVAHQLGHTDGGALVQRLYGHPRERGMRDQVKLAFSGWETPGNTGHETAANRRVS